MLHHAVVRFHASVLYIVWYAHVLLSQCCVNVFCYLVVIWGITISYTYGYGNENVLWPFIVVEAVIGVVFPLLIYIGTVLFAIVIDYVTMGRVDARKAIHSLLPHVSLVKADENEYWVIKDTFYYFVRKRPVDDKTPSCTTVKDCSRATVYFIIIIGLSFVLSASHFMNDTVVEQTFTRDCTRDLHYDCFVFEDDGSWEYVDCMNNATLSNTTFVYCYTFLRFGIDSNPVSNLAESFGFLLAIVAFFNQVFGVVKILLRLRPSRLWSVWFIITGLVLVVIALFLMFGQGSSSLFRYVIGCFQILMFGIFFLTTGALLLEAGIWEHKELTSINKPHELQLFKASHKDEADGNQDTIAYSIM